MADQTHSFDGYIAIERLSSGPLTTLYCATQQLAGRKVVIKTLSPGILPDSAFGQNIEREGSILSLLNHPNIVTMHDLRRNGAAPWLVREWVPGWTIAELLRRVGRLPVRLALSISHQIAQALAHAHRNGIVHRALHPDCVVVAPSGEVKLISFSRASSDRVARLPELLDVEPAPEVACYVSTEQLLGEAPDPRVDVYAFGALLLHMITGRTPEPGARDRGGAWLDLASDLDPGVRELLSHCLAQQSNERFADAQALCEALDALRPDETNPQASTALQLQQQGLSTGGPSFVATVRPSTVPPRASEPRSPRALRLILLVTLGLVGVLAFFVLRPWAPGEPASDKKPSSGRALVRVVVEPWARVYVDDQFFDVTPFADPVVVTPGAHQFRFEHPSAPVEKRQVSVVANEAILLDVTMSIPARSSVAGTSVHSETAPSAQEPGP
jgi:serine/threonine protein kinase